MKFKILSEEFSNKKELPIINKKDLFNRRLYFISQSDDIRELKPRVPSSYAEYNLENGKVKRVCFAPSIEQCIKALCADTEKDYYVYTPVDLICRHKWYKCTPHEVVDSVNTDEYWCLDKIKVLPIYKIRISDKIVSGNGYYYDDISQGYEVIESYFYNELEPYNILQDYAECNDINYVEASSDVTASFITFDTEKELKRFYNKVEKILNSVLLSQEGFTVIYYSLKTFDDIVEKATEEN